MEPIDDAWRALRARLEARASELAAEVRAYPGPIARCDDQLPALLAERSRVLGLAQRAAGLEAARESMRRDDWLAAASGLLREAASRA